MAKLSLRWGLAGVVMGVLCGPALAEDGQKLDLTVPPVTAEPANESVRDLEQEKAQVNRPPSGISLSISGSVGAQITSTSGPAADRPAK